MEFGFVGPTERSHVSSISQRFENAKAYAPGVFVCICLAFPCWGLGCVFPVVGGPVFAILLGMLIAIVWKRRGGLQTGIQFTSKKVLQCAVILLGFGLNLLQIAQVGLSSLPVIASTITTSLLMAFVLCKLLDIPGRIATLVGVGSSICGGSAIAATAPVIKAKDDEVALAISVVFLFNVVACLVFPTLGGVLGLSNEGFALWAGTAINDTSSVTAAAAAWDGLHPGADALAGATIVKLTRTLMIIPITFVLALWVMKEERKAAAEEAVAGVVVPEEGRAEVAASERASVAGTVRRAGDCTRPKSSFSFKRAFPMFILWFVVAACITTAAGCCGISSGAFSPLNELSRFMIVMAMVAVGLNTDVVKLVKSGGKPILLGFACWVAIAAVSLAVQALMGVW